MFLGRLTDKEYNEIDALRNTELGALKKSINHYLSEDKKEMKDSFRIGRAFHAFILEPEIFEMEKIIIPNDFDRRSKERKDQYAEWEKAGRIILKQSEFDDFYKMKESLMTHPVIKNVIKRSSNEGVYTATIEGVECKAKIDIEADGFIFDLKTTTDASPEAMATFVTKWDTARQLTFYQDIYTANERKCRGVGVIAIEKTAPFNCSINTLDIATLDHGRQNYKSAVKRLADYRTKLASGETPYTGYSDDVGVLTAKPWYFYE